MSEHGKGNARGGFAKRGRASRNQARGGKARPMRSSSHARGGNRAHSEGDRIDLAALAGASSLEVTGVALSLDVGCAGGEPSEPAKRELARALGLRAEDIASFSLVKRSVDARKKNNVHFNATFRVELVEGALEKVRPLRGVRVGAWNPPAALTVPDLSGSIREGDARIVVAGTGPAGLFCALYLAEAGLRPLVVERGAAVEERMAVIEAFNGGGPLDARTNVQFGEGGAGTFSDGKLTTGTKSPHIRHVLEAFVAAGAPEEILWQAKPHIGTDKLPAIVRNLRERIIAAGGEIRFMSRLAGVSLRDGSLRSVHIEDGATGAIAETPASRLVVACGHSARDVFEFMREEGFLLERKPFSMGVRIEHPQAFINRAQYGAAASHPALGAADYKMAVHVPAGRGADGAPRTRGVYTFCMCPGGEVVAAASEEGGVVVNGMSRFARDGENSNSALLADVRPDDLPGDDVLAGAALQRRVERAAFELARKNGGAPYSAPAQRVGDFLSGGPMRDEHAGTVRAGKGSMAVAPTYPRGVAWSDLAECLPDFVCDALRRGLPLLDAKLRGFADPDAVLTAPETRSSSPVRMIRGKNFQARLACDDASDAEPGTRVYPCGEGAGYAGGIMSAAVDGLRVAEAIARACAPGALDDPESR